MYPLDYSWTAMFSNKKIVYKYYMEKSEEYGTLFPEV